MAAKLIFETGLDGSGFERGLSRLGTGALSTFKNTVLGAFGVFSVGQAVRGTIEWASKLQDSADALGVNVEWLQKMQNGAKLVGGDIEDITKMIMEMNKSRQAALLNPASKEALAFGRAGMTQQDIQGMSSQNFVQKFIESFKNGVDTQAANDIIEVGGRSARNLLAAFQNQFRSDTPILAQELIAQLDDIGDAFTSLATDLKVTLAPAILLIMQKLRDLANSGGQFGAGALGAHEAALVGAHADYVAGAGFWTRFWNVWPNMAKGFTSAVVSAEADQKDTADQIDMAKKSERAARKARENAAPDFSLEGMKKQEKAATKIGIPSDALVSVGNFLGTSRGKIDTLAQRQTDLLANFLPKIERNTRAPTAANSSETIYPIV